MMKITVNGERQIYKFLKKDLDKYMDSKQFFWKENYEISNGKRVDCCIVDFHKKPYAFIEVKSFLNSSFARKNGKRQLLSYLDDAKEKAKFAILTDLKRFYLYKTSQNDKRFEKVSFDLLVTTLFPEAKNLFVPKNYETIKKLLSKNKFNLPNLKKSDIVYENGAFSFSGAYENFFSKLFPTFNTREKIVCRYVSLETAFNIIKNKSLKLNSVVGMNDSTEVDFIESLLYDGMKKLVGLQNQARDVYIMSCSSEKVIDDLTHWRLYGSDAKGVCLVFNVKKVKKSQLKFGKISYLDRNRPTESIEKINIFLGEVLEETKIPFAPRNFHCWAHFYKPLEYDIEKEIRLIYIDDKTLKKEWILSKPYNIVNSSVEVDLSDENLPLKLCKVILGPNCPERDVNLTQIKAFLSESGLDDVEVDISTIDSYR